ncbi:MAG TPA: hypothetical protein VH208_10740 [Myxococcaceae bacterium]|nr:hypothetical protein [Myxococcaceae bacterium]
MTEKKGVGSKILGIFVESGEGESAPAPHDKGKSPAEIVAELAGQAGAGPHPGGSPPPNLKLDKLTSSGSAPADFDAIFRDAGMDSGELDRVKKAEELLRSLPEATPQPVKKQIVEASLKAFGFEVDRILSAAQNQKRALDAYVKVNETATAKAIQDAEAQIRSFNEKIAGLRAEIEKRTAGLSTVSLSATKRKGEVQKVIDFFQAPGAPGPTQA